MTMPTKRTRNYYGEGTLSTQSSLKVRKFIEYNPGVTNEEIARGTGMRIQTVTPRTKELKENGIVWITGRAKTTSSSSAALHTLANCPMCRDHSLTITRTSGKVFQYHCNNCGHDFSAVTDSKKKREVMII